MHVKVEKEVICLRNTAVKKPSIRQQGQLNLFVIVCNYYTLVILEQL